MRTATNLSTIIFLFLLFITASTFLQAQQDTLLQISVQEIDVEQFPEVVVYVQVRQENGQPVEWLTDSAFELYEDGQVVDEIVVTPSDRFEQPCTWLLLVEANETSIEAAQVVLEKLLSKTNHQIALVGWGGEGADFSLLQSFTDDIEALNASLEKMSSVEKTRPDVFWRTVEEVLALFENTSQNLPSQHIALTLTTGQNPLSEPDPSIAKQARDLRLPFYAISLNTAPDTEALDTFTEATLGLLYNSPTPSAVRNILDDLLLRVYGEYRLAFTSKLRADDTFHILDLNVSYQLETAAAQAQFKAVSRSITVDLNLPTDEPVSGEVHIKPTIESTAPIAHAVLSVDGTILQEREDGNIDVMWNTSQLAPGDYVVDLYVRDSAGNSNFDTVTVAVANSVRVTLQSPAFGAQVDGLTEVTALVEGDASRLKSIALLVDGQETQVIDSPEQGPHTFLWDTKTASLGAHELEIRALDLINGMTLGESVSVQIVAPMAVQIISPPSDTVINGISTINVAYEVTGNADTLQNITFAVNGSVVDTKSDLAGEFAWNAIAAPAGIHILEVTAHGEEAITDQISITIDRTPSVTIDAPAQGADVSDLVEVHYTLTGYADEFQSGVFLVNDQVVATISHPQTGKNTITWDASLSPKGIYTLEIHFIGQSDQLIASEPVIVNLVAPLTVHITSPSADAILDGTVKVGYEISATDTDLAEVALHVDGVEVSTIVSPELLTGELPWDTTTSSLGQHTLKIEIHDIEGNTAAETIPVTVSRFPSVTFQAPSANSAVAGQVPLQIMFDGQLEDIVEADFLVDGQLITSLSSLQPGENTLIWDAEEAASGAHQLQIHLVDRLGREISDEISLYVVEPLRVNILSQPDEGPLHVVNYIVEANAAPLQAVSLQVGMVETQRRDDAPALTGKFEIDTSSLSLGSYTATITAEDTEGRRAFATETFTVSRKITIDINIPEENAEVTSLAPVKFTLDAQAGDIDYILLFVDGENIQRITDVAIGENTFKWTSPTSIAEHEIRLDVYDTTGTLATSDSVSVKVVPPVVLEVSAPANNAKVSGIVSVIYHVETNAADLAKVSLWVNGKEMASSTDAAPIDWDTTTLDEGLYELEVRALDSAGHQSVQALAVNVVRPVEVHITAPAAGDSVIGAVEVHVSIKTHAANLAQVQLVIDGEELPTTEENGIILWDTTQVTAGEHQVSIRVEDSAGNVGVSDTLSIFVEKPVDVTIVEPADDTLLTGDVVAVQYHAVVQDAYPLQKITLKVNDEAIETVTDPVAEGSILWNIEGLTRGIYTLEVIAESVGGYTASSTASVRVTRLFDVQIISPTEGEQVENIATVRSRLTGISLEELSSVSLLVDNTVVATKVAPLDDLTFAWDTNSLSPTEYTIVVAAHDVVGVEQLSETVTVRVSSQDNLALIIVLIGGLLLLLFVFGWFWQKGKVKHSGVEATTSPPGQLDKETERDLPVPPEPVFGKAHLRMESGPSEGTVFNLEQDEVTVGGKHTRDTVIIVNAQENHASITRDGDKFTYEDLKPEISRSKINGEELTGAHVLHEGDVITVTTTKNKEIQMRFWYEGRNG